jgi:protein SCO1/2
MKRAALLAIAMFFLANWCGAAQPHTVTGLVLKVDRSHKSLSVSCDSVPGYMDAMVMTFLVHDPKDLDDVKSGAMIEFTVHSDKKSSFAGNIHMVKFDSAEQEPQAAQRMKLLQNLVSPAAPGATLAAGDFVPDFAFIDQNQQKVTFSQFAGHVVVLTFFYTRCPNPDYCFRLNSNLGRLQKRFSKRMGRDLVLLSVVIDPEHDQGNTLSNYANIWKANAQGWHFLTGPLPDVEKLTHLFGMDFWSGEGTVTHTFHTIIIDQHRKLAANLEGNQFTAQQLGDLVETMLPQTN